MSLLASNTLANPYNSFYALASAGPAPVSSLQSPVDLIPDVNGNQSLQLVASSGGGEASLLVSSTNGNNATVTISNTIGGNSELIMGQTAAPGGTGSVSIYSSGNLVGGGQINISNTAATGTGSDIATFNTLNNQVQLGNPGIAGLTTVRNGLLVRDDFTTDPATNGIGITQTSANVGVIAGSATTGTNTLNIGSSANAPDIMTLVDSGADTAQCVIGGNGGANILMAGANGSSIPAAVIRTDAASAGLLNLGSSVSNPQTVFVNDTGAANTGFVDITGGTSASIALRLQGSNTLTGANNGYVSTNLGTGNPAAVLNLSSAYNDNPAAIQITSSTVKINKPITGYLNGTTAAQAALPDNNTVGIPGSDYGSLGAGLFCILAKTTNQTISSGQPGTQVSSMGYMSSVTQKWIGGNGFGQALVNPTRNFYITVSADFTGLVFGNTTGFDMNATWTVTYIRLSGDLGI